MAKFLQLNDLRAYVVAFKLSNYVWDIVSGWEHFARDTVGRQFTRSIDSISANVAEGFGRYGKRDKVRFYRISSGSLKEALDWNEKALKRNLVTKKQYEYIFGELEKLPKEINSLIKFTNSRLKE